MATSKTKKGRSTSSILKKYESISKGKAVQWTVTSSGGEKTQVLVKKTGNLSVDLATAQGKARNPGKVTNLKIVTKPKGKPLVQKTTTVRNFGRSATGGIPGLALGAIAAYKAEVKAISKAKQKKNRMN